VYLVQRLGREIRGEVSYDKKYFLDPTNYDFVLAIQPIALQGLYSKSPHMISHCELSLRHLATFFPSLILPGLMQSIEQSLVDVNASHRMMSSLQVMTVSQRTHIMRMLGRDSHRNDTSTRVSVVALRQTMANIAFNAEVSIGTAGGAPYLINLMNLSIPGIDIIDPMKVRHQQHAFLRIRSLGRSSLTCHLSLFVPWLCAAACRRVSP
jgi:hypothetical protein